MITMQAIAKNTIRKTTTTMKVVMMMKIAMMAMTTICANDDDYGDVGNDDEYEKGRRR